MSGAEIDISVFYFVKLSAKGTQYSRITFSKQI